MSTFKYIAQFALTFFFYSIVQAQSTGLLYDPEPPVDSAYVRVLVPADNNSKMAVHVDGKVRVPSVTAGQVSDYMVVESGKHTLSLHSPGKAQAALMMSLDVTQGAALTVAFTSSQPASKPVVFEDKKGTNKLKSMLSVYQLALQNTAMDITTSNGKTKVFTGMAYGTVNAIQVNPIKVELKASKTGETSALALATLDMTQGAAYSIFLLPKSGTNVSSYVIQNKIERYTGK